MVEIENKMVIESTKERRVIGVCEHCGDPIYEDEYMIGLLSLVFHETCLSDWIDENIEKFN